MVLSPGCASEPPGELEKPSKPSSTPRDYNLFNQWWYQGTSISKRSLHSFTIGKSIGVDSSFLSSYNTKEYEFHKSRDLFCSQVNTKHPPQCLVHARDSVSTCRWNTSAFFPTSFYNERQGLCHFCISHSKLNTKGLYYTFNPYIFQYISKGHKITISRDIVWQYVSN